VHAAIVDPAQACRGFTAMNERTLISVVIPAFNAEAFLAEAIESVLAQRSGAVEVIVVDDGSTDRTAAVASSYPVRCLRQANGGQAAARNAGVAAAQGSLVSFLDADDLWEPAKLSTEKAHLDSHPELDYVLVRMQRSLLPGARWPPGTPAKWFTEPQPGTLPSAALLRRSVLERVGPFDERFRHGSDTEWQARAADAGVRWELLDDVLVRYRIHGANASYDNAAMKREMFALLRASVARKRAAR
jgi:glycosyltransferase involved in cell wall biosynthesis